MLDIRPLRSRPFRHLATAYAINEFGNWIGDVALAILVYDRTRSPLATAALFVMLRVAPSLVAPLFATRVESIAARRLLPALNAGEAVIFAGIALSTGDFLLPLVLALTALDGVFAIASKAITRNAVATALRPEGLLREGNAIINILFTAGGAAGPVLAGLLVAGAGAGAALYLDAATFLGAALVLAIGPDLQIGHDEDANAVGRLRAGLEELRAHPQLRALVVGLACVLLFAAVAVPVEVVFAKRTLHAGDVGYGILLAAWGLGMVFGGGAFAVMRLRLGPVLVLSGSTIALGYAGLAASPTLAVACVFSAVGGFGNGAGWVAASTMIQESCRSDRLTAVMAIVESLNQTMPAIGFMIGGLAAMLDSARFAYALSAGGVAFAVLTIAGLAVRGSGLAPSAAGGAG